METPTPRVRVCSPTHAPARVPVRGHARATPLEPSLSVTAHPPLPLRAARSGPQGILAPSGEREAHATHMPWLVPLRLDGGSPVTHVVVSSPRAKRQGGVCVLVGGPQDEVSLEDGG